jgi:hypothetical protein
LKAKSLSKNLKRSSSGKENEVVRNRSKAATQFETRQGDHRPQREVLRPKVNRISTGRVSSIEDNGSITNGGVKLNTIYTSEV